MVDALRRAHRIVTPEGCIVDLHPTLLLGQAPLGERRMIPIAGGTFEGPGLRGKVLPGGADRQLWRRDSVRELDAPHYPAPIA